MADTNTIDHAHTGHHHGDDHHVKVEDRGQFDFAGPQKTVLIGFMVLGLVCMVLTWFGDDPLHTRFWSNFLHNTVFFTGVGFICLYVLCAFITAYSGWHTVVKRVWEAYSLFLVVGFGLLMVLVAGTFLEFHHLYHWNMTGIDEIGHPNYDRIIAGKSGFLNKMWYSLGTIVIVGTWALFAVKLRSLSLAEDEGGFDKDFEKHESMRKWAAAFLPIGAFTSAAMIWQWIMSVDGHWYSTMFAWYTSASWFVTAMAMTILTVIFLKSRGYLTQLTDEHVHDIGKWLFAFSIFWTYVWFSQYMLIWYSNNGEETIYFHTRQEQYSVLFYGNLAMNFFLPFLVLMRNSTKRKFGIVGFVAVVVLFGHWWDFFMMIKPGTLHTAHETMCVMVENGELPEATLTDYNVHCHHHTQIEGAAPDTHGHDAHGHDDHGTAAAGHGEAHGDDHGGDHGSTFTAGFTIPGLLDIGTFLGFLAMFMFFAFSRMAQAPFIAKNDPYLEESLHHHV